MLRVICWKWNQKGYRSQFTSEHVNVLYAMVKRYLHIPFEFCCITNKAEGINSDIRIIPLRESPVKMNDPNRPNCYRRLWAFSHEAKEVIGERFLSIDLDCVITNDITPLIDRNEDFVIWGDTAPRTPYNGSLFLLRSGTRKEVWEQFDPRTSPQATKKMRMVGSDQAWIGACLGDGEAKWGTEDGVYSYRVHLNNGKKPLPKNARIILFHGRWDPWQVENDWVKEHWRL